MPHFGTLHWRMDNFGFPYWIDMGPTGFRNNMSHERMVQTLAKFDKEIQIYTYANVGYRNGALIVARVNVLQCFLRIINHLFDDS